MALLLYSARVIGPVIFFCEGKLEVWQTIIQNCQHKYGDLSMEYGPSGKWTAEKLQQREVFRDVFVWKEKRE